MTSASGELLTDLPIWGDCPFADSLPKWCEVRSGTLMQFDEELLVLRDPELELYAYVDLHDASSWQEMLNELTVVRLKRLLH